MCNQTIQMEFVQTKSQNVWKCYFKHYTHVQLYVVLNYKYIVEQKNGDHFI